jgi:hypothetical protein
VDRYESAFDLYIADGIANRLPDGSRTSAIRFWVEVRSRAAELIPHRPLVPGIDYALTEAVRCKSHHEIGVAEAVATCSGQVSAHDPVDVGRGRDRRARPVRGKRG